MTIFYNTGLDLMADWVTQDYKLALLDDTYVEDRTQQYLSEVLPYELLDLTVDYIRCTPTGKTRTTDVFLNRIVYDCDLLGFGAPTGGQIAGSMVLFKWTGDAISSPMIANIDLGDVVMTGGLFAVVVNSAGLIYTDQGV